MTASATRSTRTERPGRRAPVLSIRNLVVEFKTDDGIVHAVDDITYDVLPGETLGIVGESGCGKSTTARLMVRLLDVTSGTVRYDGRDITRLSQRQLR
ncbi:MAG TPA: peptide ABC transporter ATP-binding protein, partial [Actinobacteria bacterium]|nr:peptide ABC transporter ATP-binding protein [Actinomycetota bacterium]